MIFPSLQVENSGVVSEQEAQDPDVILAGEIRDHETADAAFKAFLTGHMVLTGLHTNSAVASVTRLVDMGVKPYLIASAIEGILAQRLVRTVCRYCKVDEPADPGILSLRNVREGRGARVSRPELTDRGRDC